MQPLVLAIEPDLRQAAIVKRIVREKVLADVVVVDSRDAALEAMRTMVPDVLLLSALLSPRDEDELIAHLRTLENAEHLQTHTIPQLASTIGPGDAKPKGLLSAFRRRKEPEGAPNGCDPDLFAEEIRTYLQRASEKKREVRDGGGATAQSRMAAAASAPVPRVETESEAAPIPDSSWSSPFEWRPSTGTSAPASARVAAPIAGPEPSSMAFEPLAAEPPAPQPVTAEPFRFEASAPEPVAVESSVADPFAWDRPAPQAEAPMAFAAEPLVAEPPPPAPVSVSRAAAVRYPLTVRTPRGWWFEEGKGRSMSITPVPAPRAHADSDSEMRELLASLEVPVDVAVISYAQGCRIRRVRLAAA